MQEFDDEDTLRLPAASPVLRPQKGISGVVQAVRKRPALPEKSPSEEDLFFDFDTIPRSKVVLPILDDEMEDTLRRPAVRPPAAPAVRKGAWITSDGRLVILARMLRMFGFGFSSVLLGVSMATAGLSLAQVSLLLSTTLVGSVIAILFTAVFADRLGRRRSLVCFALLMALAGIALAFSQNLNILLLAAFFGTINPSSTSENTPFIAIEQAILPQTCVPDRLTDAFARYNFWAQLAGAVGGLAVTLPDILHRFAGLATSDGVHVMFALYAFLATIIAIFYICMTEKVEPASQKKLPASERVRKPLQKKSRSNVLRLSGLFVIDAFAGGLVVQSMIAFWFQQRFGASLSALGMLFFGANLLAAFSLPVASRLSRRFGLLKTMVFTHLPSQILLVLVPLMPTFWLAAILLLCRQSLSKMDVPTRQVYIIELVNPEERIAAAGVTTMARSLATSMSPFVVGVLLTNALFVFGLPFLLAGGLSSFYDLLLYRLFRKVSVSQAH